MVAHFHYVMMGSTLIAMTAACTTWWPKITGRMYNERLGQIGAWIVFIGFNLTFFTQFMLGTKGMPRRYTITNLVWAGRRDHRTVPHVPLHFHDWFVCHGGGLLPDGVLPVAISGQWPQGPPTLGVASLEWERSSLPPHHNFDETPTPEYCYNFDHWVERRRAGYVRRDAATS